MTTKKILLDVWEENRVSVTAIQGEVAARFLEVTLQDGNSRLDLTDKLVQLYLIKPDGNMIYNSATITNAQNGIFEVELTSQMSDTSGVFKECEIRVTGKTGKVLKIKGLRIIIEKASIDNAIESTNQFTALEKAMGSVVLINDHLDSTLNPHNVTAEQVGAVPSSEKAVCNGVATLDADGNLVQMPSAEDISAISCSEKGAANGVATLNANGKLTASQLDTSSDSLKIKLLNLSEEVQSAIAGTSTVLSSVADGSLTASKYADASISATKLNGSALNVCDIISGLNKSTDLIISEQSILPAVLSNATVENGTTKVTISSGGYYQKPFFNNVLNQYRSGDKLNLIVKSSVEDSSLANRINFRYLLSSTVNNYATYLGNGYFAMLNHEVTAQTAAATAQLFIDLRTYSSAVTFEIYMAKNGLPFLDEYNEGATGTSLFKDPFFKQSSPFDRVVDVNSKILRSNNSDYGATYKITHNTSDTYVGTRIRVDGYKLKAKDKIRFKVVSSDNTVDNYSNLGNIQNWRTMIRILQYNSSNVLLSKRILNIVDGMQYIDDVVAGSASYIAFDFIVAGAASPGGSVKLKEFNVINLSERNYLDFYSNENKTLFVSPTGSDNNSGYRHDQALRTFQEAINRGAETIYAKRGKYYNQNITCNGVDMQKISIQPYEANEYSASNHKRQLIEIINASIFSNGDWALDGDLLKVSFAGNTRFTKVFTNQTLTPETTGSFPSYNAGLWQLHAETEDDRRLKPVLSKALCQAQEGTFYWDGTYVYINPLSKRAYTGFAIHNDNDYAINFSNIREVKLNDVSFKFGYKNIANLLNCMNLEMHNCHFAYTMSDHGVRLDWCNANLYNCTSSNARIDGFNIHSYGATNFYNCSGFYNGDDGISHHEGCIGSIAGGEWHHNGKGGISPAMGAKVDVAYTYSHNNKYGLYFVSSSDTVNGIQCITNGNLIKDNTNAGIIIDYYNIISVSDKFIGNSADTDIGTNGTYNSY